MSVGGYIGEGLERESNAIIDKAAPSVGGSLRKGRRAVCLNWMGSHGTQHQLLVYCNTGGMRSLYSVGRREAQDNGVEGGGSSDNQQQTTSSLSLVGSPDLTT